MIPLPRRGIVLAALHAVGGSLLVVLGAGLLSLVIHEGGHVLAARLVGARILDVRIHAMLRGGSKVSTYFPFIEERGPFDGYWVTFGGIVATACLGIVGLFLLRVMRSRAWVACTAVLGASIGALGIGAVRYALTGAPTEAADLHRLSDVLRVSTLTYRGLAGFLGLSAMALVVSVSWFSMRTLLSSTEARAARRFLDFVLPAFWVSGSALMLWYWPFDLASALIVGIFAVIVYFLRRRFLQLHAGPQEGGRRPVSVSIQGAVMAVVGASALGLLSLGAPGDAHRPLPTCDDRSEKRMRLAAHWMSRRGDAEGALACLEGAYRRYRTMGVMLDLGVRYRVAGRVEESVPLLSDACTIRPDIEACWAQLARAYEEVGDRRPAAGAWRNAAALLARGSQSGAAEHRVRSLLERAAALESETAVTTGDP